MTSHCMGSVQIREEPESGIRKWKETWFKMTAEGGTAQPQPLVFSIAYAIQQWHAIEDCYTDDRLQQETLRRQQWIDEYVECRIYCHLAWVSAGRLSSSHRWLMPCHSWWNIVHRPLDSIQLCLVLPLPSSSSCICILLSTFLSQDLFSMSFVLENSFS